MKAITTKFHGPTNTRGSRISATDMDRNRIMVSVDHASRNPHVDAARALCNKMNWKGKLVQGTVKDGKVFVFLPLDVLLAHRGRNSSDVLDLGQTEQEQSFA